MPTDKTIAAYPSAGCLVEFLSDNLPQPAWVLEDSPSFLKVYTLHKRETKLPRSRILPWAGPRYPADSSRLTMDEAIARHQAIREDIALNFDPVLLWELLQGEVQRAEALWLAEFIWSDPSVDQVAGMGRALLESKTRFRFQPPLFEIYTLEQVEAKERESGIVREREEILSAGRDFFNALHAVKTSGKSLLEQQKHNLSEGAKERLKNLLIIRVTHPEDQESAKIFEQMSKGLPANPHLPLLLAQAWGILPAHVNHYLLEAGYDQGDAWASEHRQEISSIAGISAETAEAASFEDGPYISIDSPSTRDIDDAFRLQKNSEGWKLSLALACPALFWPFGGELDKAVATRASSLYLPEGDSHMLPELFGTDLFSLRQGQKRPALILDLLLDEEGRLLDKNPRQGWIETAANLHYNQVEEMIANTPQSSLYSGMLRQALELAEKLRSLRLGAGAVVIERLESEIILQGPADDPTVFIELAPSAPGAHLIVSEIMMLANAAAATWAMERKIPFIFRRQDIALPKEMQGVFNKPHEIYQVIKTLGNAALETVPKRHAGLGMAAYSPVTSPLRRYSDLLNQAQMLSFIEKGKSRLDQERLSAIMPWLNSRLEAVGKAQRSRPRYWRFLHLKQQGAKRFWDAVLLEEGPTWVLLSLPLEQIFVRGRKNIFGEKLFPGQEFKVRLTKIDPLTNEAQVAEAIESDTHVNGGL